MSKSFAAERDRHALENALYVDHPSGPAFDIAMLYSLHEYYTKIQ